MIYLYHFTTVLSYLIYGVSVILMPILLLERINIILNLTYICFINGLQVEKRKNE